MSARRRRRRRNNNSGKGGGNQPNRGKNRRRKRHGAGFWGEAGKLPKARDDVRITDDPSAVVRSLGQPPLPGREAVAGHYFTAVYDRAVTVAGAIAAAGGLIEPEELEGEATDVEEDET